MDFLPERKPPVPTATLAKWLADVAAGRWIWPRNSRCKYVTLKIDTRSGAYQMLDRDDNEISIEELLYQLGRKDSHD